jgi:RecG-like helicase
MMVETDDGFALAEKDLELRGPATSSARARAACPR